MTSPPPPVAGYTHGPIAGCRHGQGPREHRDAQGHPDEQRQAAPHGVRIRRSPPRLRAPAHAAPPFLSPRPSGGEFKPAVRWVAPQFPSVNFLISSSLFNNLTSWGLPNVRAITGRISGARGLPAGGTSPQPHPRALLCCAEAIFYCGYVAAASSYTGKLGAPLLPPSFERPRCHRAPPLPPPRPQASSSPSTTRRPMALQTRSRSAPALPPPTA